MFAHKFNLSRNWILRLYDVYHFEIDNVGSIITILQNIN